MEQDMVELEYNISEKYENIRVFTAGLNTSTVPLYDLYSVMEKWSRPSPGTVVSLCFETFQRTLLVVADYCLLLVKIFTVYLCVLLTFMLLLDSLTNVQSFEEVTWHKPHFLFTAALGKGQVPFHYFSATCWIFGRRFYETLGYPIGLLESDWGGTPDEAWMSPDALKQCDLDDVQDMVKRY